MQADRRDRRRPAIVDGVVYVASLDKHLYAIDLPTGKQKWKTKLGYMKASPAVKGDRVYVGDLDGKFYCVNAVDGKVVWTFETEARNPGRRATSTATTSSSVRTTPPSTASTPTARRSG